MNKSRNIHKPYKSKKKSKHMQKVKLSGFVVVRNEEKNIDRCLKSLDFCDEIIVVDQESTDNTIKLAKKYTDKIYSDKCWGYADPSRKLAASKCTGDWIIYLDADEEITGQLKKEILKAIKSDKFDAYKIHFNFYEGKYLKKSSADDYQIRLHRKNALNYTSKIHVCSVLKKNMRSKKLKNSINHYALTSFKQMILKLNRYAKIQAQNDKKYNQFPRKYLGIFYLPVGYFIYEYFFNKKMFDGWIGLKDSFNSGYYQILVLKNVWFKK